MALYLLRSRPLPLWLDPLLTKSATPAGTRWITVHPNGPDEDGVPVLIRESTTNPGTYHVIGGADGKLNHLQLNRVGTKEDWDRRAKEKKEKKKADNAAKQARGEGGDDEEDAAGQAETQEEITAASRRNQKQFVDAVARKLDWDDNWYKDAGDFQREGMSPSAASIAANAHLKNWVSKASKAHKDVRERLRKDHESRISAGLGNLSMDSNPYRVTEAELSPGALLDKYDHHLAHADASAAEAEQQGEQEAQAYEGAAFQIGGSDPADALKLAQEIGRPNTTEGRAILGEFAAGKLAGSDAADALTKLAGAVRSGNVLLDAGEDARSHTQAAQLYQRASEALAAGDNAGAARHAEEAKRLVGDRQVSALDLIGKAESTGRGYKPPERKRARANIHEEGSAAPDKIDQQIAQVEAAQRAHMQAVGNDLALAPVAVLDALEEQKKALNKAKEAAAGGHGDLAADWLLQAERYAVGADKHAEKDAEQQAKIVEMKQRMRDGWAEVGEVRKAGEVQIGAGADLDTETKDMANAKDVLIAGQVFTERKRELQEAQAKAKSGDLKGGREIAESDTRVKPEALDPETMGRYEAAALKRIQEDAETGVHRDLLDRLEDTNYFKGYGGGSQVRKGQLDKYIAAGADAMMTILGQSLGNGQMLDRTTLDLLGPKASARLMADYLANTTTADELSAIKQGVAEYHKTRAASVAREALRACDECMEQARKFEIQGVGTAYDLSEMEAYNNLRLKAVNQAMASIGSAYGELNMGAELVWALGGARKTADQSVSIAGGEKSDQALVLLANAMGLKDGEYKIQPMKKRGGRNKQVIGGAVNVTGAGLKRIVKTKSREDSLAEMRLQAIKTGRETTMADGTKVAGDRHDWLPQGIARRPQSTWQDPEKRAGRYDSTPDLENAKPQELTDHVAGRIAKGEPTDQVYRDLLDHPEITNQATWTQRVNDTFGIQPGEDFNHEFIGRMRERGNRLAKEYHQRRGGTDADLHSQSIEEDHRAVEAIHRTIAQNPYGVYAFKGVTDLTVRDQAHVRDYFYKHVLGGMTPDERKEQSRQEAPDPEYDANGSLLSPSAPLGDAKETREWEEYSDWMGGPEGALRATLARIKSATMGMYAQNHQQVTGQQLQTGTTPMEDAHAHYLATLPADERAKLAEVRKIRRGTAARDNAEQAAVGQVARRRPDFGLDRLHQTTVGQQVEGQIGGMWDAVADNFNPGKPVKLVPNLSMGGRFVNQQRAVKAIRTQKRIMMALGVGSGKTLISLAGFTDAKHHGEASHALYAVPQAVQGQFGAEAATYIDPNKEIKWHAKPGADQAERHSALADTDKHIVVTTHQSLRDDVLKAIASHRNIPLKQAEQMMGSPQEAQAVKAAQEAGTHQPLLSRSERAAAVKAAFEHHGWGHRFEYFGIDEAHEVLNRKGKPNSVLANVMDAISDNSKHYVPMTGTPVKNDASEAYDIMAKIRPDKYGEEGREDFLRTYDGLGDLTPRVNMARGTQRGSKDDKKDWSNVAMAEAIQRELAPHMFATRVPLKTTLKKRTIDVKLSDEHRKKYDAVTDAFREANAAHARGDVNLKAVKALTPDSFEKVPEEEQEAHARQLGKGLPMLRETAYNRALHTGTKDNAKTEALSKLIHEFRNQPSARGHQGKAGIVFTSGIKAAQQLAGRMKKDGHRVALITGPMSVAEKEREKAKFQPPGSSEHWEARAQADVMIATNTVSAGMDAPRGEFVVHHDVPMTAKTHEQRTARAHRLSNDHDVEEVNLISDTPHETKNKFRLDDKYGLSDMTQNPAEDLDDSGLLGHINTQRVGIALGRAKARAQARESGEQARDLLGEARKLPVTASGRVSPAQIARALKVGQGRAAQLADQLHAERQRRAS